MVDIVTLEVMRAKLESIADDGARAVVRTAISPIVSESKDCSCSVFSKEGELIVGGGTVEFHFHTGANGVLKILDLCGDDIHDGDIFIVNDPYSGGGFHAQDVFIHQPIFCEGELIAWVGSSAHMMDMGGGAPGSFVPSATDCYQEALRFPPIRLYRKGVEQEDIWALIRNNIRTPDIIEMDMRALISGTNVISDSIKSLVSEYGMQTFLDAIGQLRDLTEKEFRQRISELEPGTYSAKAWAEWTEENFLIPCELTVKDGHLIFDYEGAAGQTLHYYNSKPYVIQSLLGVALAGILGQDLPYNEGIFKTFEVRCREGSILDAQPPAPIGAPHLEVGNLAVETAITSLNLAILATSNSSASAKLAAPPNGSGLALHGWAYQSPTGESGNWLMMEGGAMGSGAGHDRDAVDYSAYQVAKGAVVEFADVEVTEALYPIKYDRRKPRPGKAGAGKFRAGHGMETAYVASGDVPLFGVFMGIRERFPPVGLAGGYPGSNNRMTLRRQNGDEEQVPLHQLGVMLLPGEMLIAQISGGGGWGDPLDRDPAGVQRDVKEGRLTEDEAVEVYGVIIGDDVATAKKRRRLLEERLSRAEMPSGPINTLTDADIMRAEADLYPGVKVVDGYAVSTRSGAVLVESPRDWTDGCAVIKNFLPSSDDVDIVAYLDPITGHTLAVDVVAAGTEKSFSSRPNFWVSGSQSQNSQRVLSAEHA